MISVSYAGSSPHFYFYFYYIFVIEFTEEKSDSYDLPLSPFGIMDTAVFVEKRFHEREKRWYCFGEFPVRENELASGEDFRQGVQVE